MTFILKLVLASMAFVGVAAQASVVPTFETSGNEKLDSALYNLYLLYHTPECVRRTQSFEYVAPLLSEALEEQPELLVNYLMPIPLYAIISEIHLKDIYEYQLAKVKAYEQVLEKQQKRNIEFSEFEQFEFAFDHAKFRRPAQNASVDQDLLMFSIVTLKDGSTKKEVRWISNSEQMFQNELTWLNRKDVTVGWELQQKQDGSYSVIIVDRENSESMELALEKVAPSTDLPAQWTLTEKSQGFSFYDYPTNLCDTLKE